MSDEIILSGSEETLKPVITLLIGINQMLQKNGGNEFISTNSAVKRRHKPQINLFFQEEGVKDSYRRSKGHIGFRIMNKESESITNQELKAVASIIKRKFAGGGGFVWNKGKIMCSYSDWDLGYQLQLLCQSEAEGKRVIEQVLDIRGHSPEWENMTINRNAAPEKAFPNTKRKRIILGKSVDAPNRRPVVKVKFQYATLTLHGLVNPICLVDRSNRFSNPIERG
ncbi:hypothetical protein [Coleofasciculus sp. FACHB-SPT9]|uniref:hypothetical protein n=1 Tax=Cyanophyceae TaxID=3028117 RepID=UPI001685B744|nr:hypothetical protein [Coleofasciculus sp. FACHB-SPT9]MBD1887965.1 hypothetical protein [Coleofasciculus sp. FACHB-SPT9]